MFSDMRNVTGMLDLENTNRQRPEALLAVLQARGLIPDLQGVTVYVVGANGGGRDVHDWQSVRQFWAAFFGRARAEVAGYSAFGNPPVLPQ
jgi:hypothetical protein